MIIGIPKEIMHGEGRVSAIPETVAKLKADGYLVKPLTIQFSSPVMCSAIIKPLVNGRRKRAISRQQAT